MFYGRNKELTELNQLWKQDQFEMIIVYGRRRVGKTSLINEFSKDKKAIYYIATESSASVNLKSFSSACTQLTGHTSSTYDSYEDLFDELYQLSLNQRIVVAIDEYPYLAKVKPEISSLLQKYIDTKFKETKMMLILCGSSMSFMENQVLGYQSPCMEEELRSLK